MTHMRHDCLIKVSWCDIMRYAIQTLVNVFAEIHSAKASGKPFRDNRYVDVYREKSVKIVVKVIVPVKDYPKVSICRSEEPSSFS